MVNIRQICPELAIRARDELHEVGNCIPEYITTLRDWIENHPHLQARTDDQFLLTFLRGTKYSLEKAKQKVDYFYTIRSLSPELFLSMLIDDRVIRLARLGPFLPLPKPLKIDGPRIHIIRYGHISPKEFNIIEFLKLQLRITEIEMFEDDNSIIGGVVNIFDMMSISLGYILQFDASLIKKIGVFIDKAMPIRVKGIHLINVPKEAIKFINITLSVMPKKIKERMIVHSTLEGLYKHVPKEYLPEEYGGTNGRLQDTIDYWEKHLLGYKQFFEEDIQYRANEKLRIGTKISSESLFGLEGSFRKLELD